jgi:hypothetical protein
MGLETLVRGLEIAVAAAAGHAMDIEAGTGTVC